LLTGRKPLAEHRQSATTTCQVHSDRLPTWWRSFGDKSQHWASMITGHWLLAVHLTTGHQPIADGLVTSH